MLISVRATTEVVSTSATSLMPIVGPAWDILSAESAFCTDLAATLDAAELPALCKSPSKYKRRRSIVLEKAGAREEKRGSIVLVEALPEVVSPESVTLRTLPVFLAFRFLLRYMPPTITARVTAAQTAPIVIGEIEFSEVRAHAGGVSAGDVGTGGVGAGVVEENFDAGDGVLGDVGASGVGAGELDVGVGARSSGGGVSIRA